MKNNNVAFPRSSSAHFLQQEFSWLRIFSQLKGRSIRSPCNLASWAIIFASGREGSVLSSRAAPVVQARITQGKRLIFCITLGSVIFIPLFPSLTISWLTPSPHWNLCLGLVAHWCVRGRLGEHHSCWSSGKHREATEFTGLSHTCSGCCSLL